MIADWYGLAAVDVVKLFRSNSVRGLNSDEIISNREKYGNNKIIEISKKKFVITTFKELFKPWTILLILAAIVFSYLGKIDICIFTAVFLVLDLAITINTYYKKYEEIKNIEKLNYNLCSVLRGGMLTKIPTEELVVGDIVTFSKGDIIPGEVRIIECDKLKVNEVNITGDESIVDKFSAKIGGDNIPISQMSNVLFKSSVVVSGEGEGIVVSVGMNTEFGSIMDSFFNTENERNFITDRVKKTVNIFTVVPFFIAIFVLIYKKASYEGWYESALICMSGMPVEITFILFEIFHILKRYLKRDKIALKNLSIMEELSQVNAICMEKEDALTKNEMFIKNIYDNTDLKMADKDLAWTDNVERIMNIGILCNDYKPSDYSHTTLNIAERSILDYVERRGIDIFEVKGIKRIFEIPYDAEKRIKTTVNRIDRKYRANAKGALDVILEKCTHFMVNGTERELTDGIIDKIKLADIKMSSDSLYVMAFAYRNFNYRPSENENIESNLVFAGLVGFENPIKDDFKYTLERCRNDGIKPVIFTEDGKLTALSVGNKTGILNEGNTVISGIEIDNMSNDEFEKHVENIGMYSRISNKNKENIVKTLKKFGYNIIISGSKLTELPTLKEANLFISSGEKCNKIVKRLSDIFFHENDFGKILKIIENSKRLIVSTRDMIKNIILGDISIMLILLISSLQNKNMPFNIYAITWMIFICFNLNGIAILTNYVNVSVEYDYEVEKERLWKINIFSILVSSIFMLSVSFSGYYFLLYYKHIPNADNFILYSFIYANIIYVFVNKFEKKLQFNLLIIANIVIQSLILFTDAGKLIFGVNALSLYELQVLCVVLLVEGALLGIKRAFS